MKQGSVLFVYGTLRPGERASLESNRRVMHLGEDRINGLMYHLGGFPGVTFDSGFFDDTLPAVVGDLFLLRDNDIVAQLDAYEGYPNLYGRRQTVTEGGRKVWCYFYRHVTEDMEPLRVGDWKISKNANLRMEEAK